MEGRITYQVIHSFTVFGHQGYVEMLMGVYDTEAEAITADVTFLSASKNIQSLPRKSKIISFKNGSVNPNGTVNDAVTKIVYTTHPRQDACEKFFFLDVE
jgi:hypothetical protein